MSPTWFFEEMPVNVMLGPRRNHGGRGVSAHEADSPWGTGNPLGSRETVELLRAWRDIDDAKVRQRIVRLIQGVGAEGRVLRPVPAGKRKRRA